MKQIVTHNLVVETCGDVTRVPLVMHLFSTGFCQKADLSSDFPIGVNSVSLAICNL